VFVGVQYSVNLQNAWCNNKNNNNNNKKKKLLHVLGHNGPSTGSTQLYKTVALHFLHVADLLKNSSMCNIHVEDQAVHWKQELEQHSGLGFKGIGASRSTTYILHTEEFSTALIHAENVKQLHYTTVWSLMMDQ
jgi:hypothetical protein